MNALLIVFKLQDTKVDYTYLFETIDDLGCITINNWTYAIMTKLSPKNIYDTLRPHFKNEDTLLVLTVKGKWQGRGPNELVDWILKNI